MQEKVKIRFAARQTLKETFSRLGLLVGIFFVTVTLLNWVHALLGIRLIPVFEKTVSGFRSFIHYTLDLLFFQWITLAIDWLIYFATLLLSKLFQISPYLPDFQIPGWFMDLAIISIALLRVFESAYLVVPRSDRESAYSMTTEEHYKAIDIAQGIFWGRIHSLSHIANEWLWKLTDFIRIRIFRSEESRIVRLIVIEILGGLLMWGFIRLIGYLVNVPLTLNIEAPVLAIRRKVFFVFCVCLCTAIFGIVLFYIVNGLMINDSSLQS